MRPAGKEHIVLAGRSQLAGGRDLQVPDLDPDPDVAQHRFDRLRDLELLGIEILHQHELQRLPLVPGVPEQRLRLLGIVRLDAQVHMPDQARRDWAHGGPRRAQQEILDDRAAVDAEGDRLAELGVVIRGLGELEEPLLHLEPEQALHLDARAGLEGLRHVGRHPVDDMELTRPEAGRPGRELRDEAEGDPRHPRDPTLPVVGIGGQIHHFAAGPPGELERAGPDRPLEEAVFPARGARRQHAEHRQMGRQRAKGPLGGHGDPVLPVFLDRVEILVHERLDELRVVADAPEGVEDAVGVERGSVVKGHALAQGEAPGRVVDRLPRLGQRRRELVVVGHVDQRVEDVPEHGGGGNRIVVRRIEDEHAL